MENMKAFVEAIHSVGLSNAHEMNIAKARSIVSELNPEGSLFVHAREGAI